jgi:hypothetical protein
MFSKETAWEGMRKELDDIGDVLSSGLSAKKSVLFEGDTASGDGISVGCQVRGLQKKLGRLNDLQIKVIEDRNGTRVDFSRPQIEKVLPRLFLEKGNIQAEL